MATSQGVRTSKPILIWIDTKPFRHIFTNG